MSGFKNDLHKQLLNTKNIFLIRSIPRLSFRSMYNFSSKQQLRGKRNIAGRHGKTNEHLENSSVKFYKKTNIAVLLN